MLSSGRGRALKLKESRTCWQFHSCSTCWVYGGVVYEWTRNLLEYVSPRSYNMKYTLLELIGLASIGTVSWFLFREVWKFMYSTFIGHALGRSLSLKNIGQWAGRSNTSSILWFDKSMINEWPSLPAFFFQVVTGATDGIGRAYAEEVTSTWISEPKFYAKFDLLFAFL